MRCSRRLIVALGVVLVTLVGPALSSASSSARSLAGISLQDRDLPRGFFVMVPHYETNAVIVCQDHVSVALLKREGRVLGYRGQDARDSSVFHTVSLQPGPLPTNNGFVMFVVPEHNGPYTILWNEAGAIPLTPLAALPVFPSH